MNLGVGLGYLELDKGASGSLMPGVLSRERPSYLDVMGFSPASKDVTLKEKSYMSELRKNRIYTGFGIRQAFTFQLPHLLA